VSVLATLQLIICRFIGLNTKRVFGRHCFVGLTHPLFLFNNEVAGHLGRNRSHLEGLLVQPLSRHPRPRLTLELGNLSSRHGIIEEITIQRLYEGQTCLNPALDLRSFQ
jgi:hypothetical protein